MECVFKARDHIDCIWRALEEINIDSPSTKGKFVSTMLFVAFNHCDGIQTLVEKKNFASAYALVRPLLESTFRAFWLHRCATEDQVAKCIDSDKWKPAWDLINAYEAEMEFSSTLSNIWSELRPTLHSYTHGGLQIASRHINSESTVTPNVSDEEVLQLMQIVGLISWLIFAEFIDLAKSDEHYELYENLGRELHEWAF